MGLTQPLFEFAKFWTSEAGDLHGVSGRDLIMLVGGLFLIGKATYEIHDKLEGEPHEKESQAAATFGMVVLQIVLIDIVFSLDSVITAVGMVESKEGAEWVALTVMITAVVISILVMLAFAGVIANFVERHPTLKMLALSFLILIGFMLFAEGLHLHIPKGYVYFAMGFSIFVEMLNLRVKSKRAPVNLRGPKMSEPRSEVRDAG
jgi:predicted tellurium resistance membrane protein TerC